jgi:hypothetical protein
VVFKVENYIPKKAEGQLTDDILKKICTDAILKDSAPRGNEPTKRATKVSNGISTNSGMHHIHLACHGAAGSFDMKLSSRYGRNMVVLEVSLPVRLPCAEDPGVGGQKDSRVASTTVELANSQEPIPEGLKVCCIDDSKVFILLLK